MTKCTIRGFPLSIIESNNKIEFKWLKGKPLKLKDREIMNKLYRYLKKYDLKLIRDISIKMGIVDRHIIYRSINDK